MKTRDDLATARAHRAWLRTLPALTGRSLTRIADDVGLARSTLTRPLKDGDEGTSTLHARTVAKVVESLNVPPPEAVDQAVPRAAASRSAAIGMMQDATRFAAERTDDIGAAVRALIGGRNGVDPYTMQSRALELVGYLPGDIVLVDVNASPKPGDAVCAQVFDWNRLRFETVMRVFERATPVDVLVPRTMDPALQGVVVVDKDRVTVTGVVLPHRLRAA